jgi:glutamyl-tRNA synthetase
MTVTARFAPSPTGFLHIGGARTALFNWLFARHHGGTFRLRIEDTDRVRSTPEAVAAIIDGLQWLGLQWEGGIVHQSVRAARHAEVARQLHAAGRAYYCYCTPAELAAMRDQARAEKRSVRYDGTWRDRDPAEAPADIPPVIRLKAPQHGRTTIRDRVQGEVTVANSELDDLIILRADGTPTYNLSVVVDDHDMGITHVIRGDDHLNNAFRQTQIYRALDWPVPEFAHLPLIHGPDGAKLSKRHGALSVDAYRDMGYLPEALRNYLLRLGWSHGDDEILSTDEAIAWFDLDAVGRAPARFDFAKLDSINAHYIRNAADQDLIDLVVGRLVGLGHHLGPTERTRLSKAMSWLKIRSKTINEMAGRAEFYVVSRPRFEEKAARLLAPHETRSMLLDLREKLAQTTWTFGSLQIAVETFAHNLGIDIGAVAQPLRAALTGSLVSPGIIDVLDVLGRDETLARLADAATGR